MSTLSYVLIRSSYNFGDMISCLRVHWPTFFVEWPPSNGGALLLSRSTVLGSLALGESFLYGEYFNILIWSIVDVISSIRSSVSFLIFSLESCLLASIVSYIMTNWFSDLLSILFFSLGILKPCVCCVKTINNLSSMSWVSNNTINYDILYMFQYRQ